MWKEDRGFGFITVESPTGERDVFLHISEANRAGIRDIEENDRLMFNVSYDAKSGRSKAVDIEVVL
jgi:CspA family cold shock protein